MDHVPTNLNQLDAFHDLLPTLARGLDVRDIFEQLSAAATRIIPHDTATLMLRIDGTDCTPAPTRNADIQLW
jgi:hypothetical protein